MIEIVEVVVDMIATEVHVAMIVLEMIVLVKKDLEMNVQEMIEDSKTNYLSPCPPKQGDFFMR